MSQGNLFNNNLLKTMLVTAALSLTACSDNSTEQSATKNANHWSIDSAQSQLNFSSTKNGDITEEHSFNSFEGNLNADGSFTLTIELNSVDTGIEIRDERMQKHLFMTTEHPQAVISGNITPDEIPATSSTQKITAELNLVGNKSKVEPEVKITRVSDNTLTVETTKPLTLSSENLGLKSGVDKLQEIAGLNSISDEVPVTFSFTLVKK